MDENIEQFESVVAGMRPALRIGFRVRRKRVASVEVQKEPPTIEPPRISVITMDRDELERLPVFAFYR